MQKITKLKEIMRLDFDVLMEMIIEINPHKVGIINHVLCGVFALLKKNLITIECCNNLIIFFCSLICCQI